jgi:GDP-4-dehydro-6-deoxy-D-mannose reductase
VSLAGRSAQLEVLIARPFNHIGPGQDARFVVAGFAQQLAHIIDGGEPVLAVGNLEAERDFLDVRDVVRAYVALMADGTDGEIYNIAGGRPVAVREILRRLILLANVPVAVQEDEARMRPSEIPRFFGSAQKIRAAVGWEAQISLDASLLAILDAARKLEPAG